MLAYDFGQPEASLGDRPYLETTLNDPCLYANLAASGTTAMVKWILIGLLALPLAELGVFILVAASIGLGWALLIMLATTIAGFMVLRWAGYRRIALFRSVSGGGISGIEAGIEANPDGFMLILGSILLALPGFISDVVGALLLLGPVRHWCAIAFHRAAGLHEQPKEAVIDLAAGEWQEVPDRQLENPRSKSQRP
jgi:UPF0716 protein FxsA